jgi:hypothetical protein
MILSSASQQANKQWQMVQSGSQCAAEYHDDDDDDDKGETELTTVTTHDQAISANYFEKNFKRRN